MYIRLGGLNDVAVKALQLVLMTLTNNGRTAGVQKQCINGDRLHRGMLLHGGDPL